MTATLSPLLLSAMMYVAVLAGFLAMPPARAYLVKVGNSSKVILAGMIGLMLAGQFVDRQRRTFPFSVFHMFGSVHTDAGRGAVSIYQLQGLTRDGRRVLINAERLFPTLGFGTMRMGHELRELINLAALTPEGGPRLDSMLEAIAAGYHRLGFDQLRRVEVIRTAVPTREDFGPEAPSEVVWVHEVGGRP